MKSAKNIFTFLAPLTLVLSVTAQEPVISGYTFREIVIPGRSNINANAINNSGTIVGTSDSGPFVLRRDRLETISIPGATSATPRGINGLGTVVGSYTDEQNYERPFLRKRNGRVMKLPWGPTGENPGSANGINASGTVVGDSFAIDTNGFVNTGSAIIFSRQGMGYFDLDAAGGLVTRLRGINSRGNLVGNVTSNQTFSSGGFFIAKSAAFILDRDGARMIETPWPWVIATGINARDTVVGMYIGAPGPVADYHGFVLASGALATVDLTTTNEWPPFVMADAPNGMTLRFNLAGEGTSINGINDRGQIVAVSFAHYINRTFFTSVTYHQSFVGTPVCRSSLNRTMSPASRN